MDAPYPAGRESVPGTRRSRGQSGCRLRRKLRHLSQSCPRQGGRSPCRDWRTGGAGTLDRTTADTQGRPTDRALTCSEGPRMARPCRIGFFAVLLERRGAVLLVNQFGLAEPQPGTAPSPSPNCVLTSHYSHTRTLSASAKTESPPPGQRIVRYRNTCRTRTGAAAGGWHPPRCRACT